MYFSCFLFSSAGAQIALVIGMFLHGICRSIRWTFSVSIDTQEGLSNRFPPHHTIMYCIGCVFKVNFYWLGMGRIGQAMAIRQSFTRLTSTGVCRLCSREKFHFHLLMALRQRVICPSIESLFILPCAIHYLYYLLKYGLPTFHHNINEIKWMEAAGGENQFCCDLGVIKCCWRINEWNEQQQQKYANKVKRYKFVEHVGNAILIEYACIKLHTHSHTVCADTKQTRSLQICFSFVTPSRHRKFCKHFLIFFVCVAFGCCAERVGPVAKCRTEITKFAYEFGVSFFACSCSVQWNQC